jgi:hypothetical protein
MSGAPRMADASGWIGRNPTQHLLESERRILSLLLLRHPTTNPSLVTLARYTSHLITRFLAEGNRTNDQETQDSKRIQGSKLTQEMNDEVAFARCW